MQYFNIYIMEMMNFIHSDSDTDVKDLHKFLLRIILLFSYLYISMSICQHECVE